MAWSAASVRVGAGAGTAVAADVAGAAVGSRVAVRVGAAPLPGVAGLGRSKLLTT